MALTLKTVKNLTVTEVTADDVKQAEQKGYNESAWIKRVDSYLKYDKVKFYTAPGSIYKQDYFVEYITEEGIRFLGEVTYSSSLSSGGFVFGWFDQAEGDNLEMKIYSYEEGRISTTNEAREYMKQETKRSDKFFTKIF